MGFPIKDTTNGFLTRCPAHNDNEPSLNVDKGNHPATGEGTALLQCRSGGCNAGAIAQAFGLEVQHLWDNAASLALAGNIPLRKPRGRPRANFPSWGEALSVVQAQDSGATVSTHIYHDATGREVLAVFRIDTGNGKSFRQLSPREDGKWSWQGLEGRAPLYRWPSLLAKSSSPVIVVEGEKKVELLEAMGLVGTCSVQGANSARKTDWGPLRGREVVVLPDNDDAGRGYAREVKRLALNAGAVSVRIVELPGLKVGHDVIDWTRAHGKDVELLLGVIENPDNELVVDVTREVTTMPEIESMPLEVVPPAPAVHRVVAWQWLTFDEALAQPPIDWIVGDLIPRGSSMLLVGEPRAGKSFAALDLALALCSSSSSWLGSNVLSHGRVAYLALEGHAGIAGRLRAYRARHPMRVVKGFEAVSWRGAPPLTEGWEPFAGELRRLHREAGGEVGVDGLDLVVIDTLALAGLPDENDSATVGAVLRRVNALAAELRCTFLLLHHPRKAQGDMRARGGCPTIHDVRGSGALVGNVDCVMALDYRDGREERALVVLKSKDSMAPPPAWFRLEAVQTGKVDMHGRAETSCVVRLAQAPQVAEEDVEDAKARAFDAKLDRDRDRVLERLLRAVEGHAGIAKTALRQRGGSSTAVNRQVLEEAISQGRIEVRREGGGYGCYLGEVSESTKVVLGCSRLFQNNALDQGDGTRPPDRGPVVPALGGTGEKTHTHSTPETASGGS